MQARALRRRRGFRVVLAVVVATLVGPVPLAQGAPRSEIPPSGVLQTGPPTARSAREAAGQPVEPAPLDEREVPFRPTISAEEYRRAKAGPAGHTPGPPVSAPSSPPALSGEFAGLSESDSGRIRPPDTHGAYGAGQYVEIVNAAIRVHDASGTPLLTASLASFFGYSGRRIFDPRVAFDPEGGGRWIALGAVRPDSVALQRFFVAVSAGHDATGTYQVYEFDVGGLNEFFDFPQLGLADQGVLVTANIFSEQGGSFLHARFFCLPKADLYAGGATSFSTFDGLAGTLAPPIVTDDNPEAYLVAAPPSGSALRLYRASGCGTETTLESRPDVRVGAYRLPPDARQPGIRDTLDTKDARFVNASTQTGTSLWQVHSVRHGAWARPRFYEIDAATSALNQSGTFSRSDTSYDFNASIAATADGTAFVTWSAVDPTVGVAAEIRFSGRRPSDLAGWMNAPGTALGATSVAYDPIAGVGSERWGDYSAVILDHTDPGRAWIVNEYAPSTTEWGSRIAQIGF